MSVVDELHSLPAKRTRTPRVIPSVARCVIAIVESERKHRDAARAWQTLALALERAGDSDGATLLRESRAVPFARGVTQLVGEHKSDALEWFDPTTDLSDELIVAGELAAALDGLAEELASVDAFLAAGIDPPTRALFVGPSGVGKTLAVRWLGWKLGLPVAVIALSRVVSSYMGTTAERFTKAIEVARATLMDALAFLRGSTGAQS